MEDLPHVWKLHFPWEQEHFFVFGHRVFENRVLRRTFGPKRLEKTAQ
jgi:hypothetical protein